MGFADRYLHAVNSSDLRDDEHHHATDALCAAALADTAGAGIGSLLSRVKYADGTATRWLQQVTDFFVANANIANAVKAEQYFDPQLFADVVKA